jgi:hypothetical protein
MIPVDGHVHFHDCFAASAFLDAARRQFAMARAGYGIRGEFGPPGILFLCETGAGDPFARLSAQLPTADLRWTMEPTAEAESRRLRLHEVTELIVIAGRQCITTEGLEVLALGTTDTFAADLPLRELVDQLNRRHALPVLPWGLGKWWFRRGEIIRRLIREANGRQRLFLLSDQSGRPRTGVASNILRLATALQIPILAGSDPLAMASEVETVGSYGFWLDCTVLNCEQPALSILQSLRGLKVQPAHFGRRDALPRAVLRQLSWRRHRR